MDLILVELTVFVVLLGLSGFFSGSETALFSLNRSQLEEMTRKEHPQVDRIRRLLNEPRRLIVTILIGNELVNVSASVISAGLVIHFLGGEEKWWVNIFIMLPILLLVGEITPKTIAVKRNVDFAAAVAAPLEKFARLITPLRLVVRWVADGLTTMLIGGQRSPGNIVTEDMVRTLAVEAEKEGVLDGFERRFIDNIFNLGNHSIGDLMSPRSTMIFLDAEQAADALREALRTTPLTRFPVYRGSHDQVIGILHVRDLLHPDTDIGQITGEQILPLLRQPMLVPKSLPAATLFFRFRKQHRSIALVIDEFGGVVGLISMDDLMGAIFGSLRPAPDIHLSERAGASDAEGFEIQGTLPVATFNQRTGADLPLELAETMGGLIIHLHGELPREGVVVPLDGWEFAVKTVHGNRVESLMCIPEQLDRPELENSRQPDETAQESTSPNDQGARPDDPAKSATMAGKGNPELPFEAGASTADRTTSE